MGSQQTPTRRELEVLSILWEMGEASVRDVYERMRRNEKIAQNTVQTFLRAMEDKGLVKHRTVGRAFVYRPAYSQQQSLKSFVDAVFRGAAHDLVVSLLRTEKLSDDELRKIQDMVEQMRKQRDKRKR